MNISKNNIIKIIFCILLVVVFILLFVFNFGFSNNGFVSFDIPSCNCNVESSDISVHDDDCERKKFFNNLFDNYDIKSIYEVWYDAFSDSDRSYILKYLEENNFDKYLELYNYINDTNYSKISNDDVKNSPVDVTIVGDVPSKSEVNITQTSDSKVAVIEENIVESEKIERSFTYDISVSSASKNITFVDDATITLDGINADKNKKYVIYHLIDDKEALDSYLDDPNIKEFVSNNFDDEFSNELRASGEENKIYVNKVLATVNDDGSITFPTNSFSTFYVAEYTVEFYYEDTVISIPGNSSILLSQLFLRLGIAENVSNVVDVKFSSGDLIAVSRSDDGVDWVLTSLAPFSTEEALDIYFNDGRVLSLRVTDYAKQTTDDAVEISKSGINTDYQFFGTFYPEIYAGYSRYGGLSDIDAYLYDSSNNQLTHGRIVKITAGVNFAFSSDTWWFYVYGGLSLNEVDGLNNNIVLSWIGTSKPMNVKIYPRVLYSNDSYCTVTLPDIVSVGTVSRRVTIEVNGSRIFNEVKTCPSRLSGSSSDISVSYDENKYTMIKAGTSSVYTIAMKSKFLVKYDANGGSGAPGSQNAVYGTSLTLSSTVPVRVGYNFLGWSTNSTASSASYSAGSSATFNSSSDVVLYAVWSPISYSVSFNGNGSTSGSMSNQSFQYGIAQVLNTNNYSRSFTVSFNTNGGAAISNRSVSSAFNGWEDRGTFIHNGVTYDYTALDVPYYVGTYGDLLNAFGYDKYSLVNHYVNWGKNEGRSPKGSSPGFYPVGVSVNNLTTSDNYVVPLYAHWTDTIITLPSTTKTGYTLAGWYSDSNLNSKVGDAGSNYTVSSSSTLYAKWSAIPYYVSFNANGGNGSMGNESFYYGTEKRLNANAFTKTGYSFSGWNTSSDGSGTSYANNAAILNLSATGETITLYAMWSPNNYNYTVCHYKEVVTSGNYDSLGCDTVSGAYGTQTSAVARTITGYSSKPFNQIIITEIENNNVINIYYDANFYNYTIYHKDKSGTVLDSISGTAKYGYVFNESDYVKSFTHYKFINTDDATYTMTNSDNYFSLYYDLDLADYKINYVVPALGGESNIVKETINSSGFVGDPIVYSTKSYTGFTYVGVSGNSTILSDGSSVLNVLYSRNNYNVSFEFSGTIPESIIEIPPENMICEYEEVINSLPTYSVPLGYSYTWSVTAPYTVTGDVNIVCSFALDVPYYLVHYYLDGTTNKVFEDKAAVELELGNSYNEDAISIPGYRVVGNGSSTVVAGFDSNEIIFYYEPIDSVYKVVHHLGDTAIEENLIGKAFDIPSYTLNDNPGYSFDHVVVNGDGIIEYDGTTVVDVYYIPNKFSITYILNKDDDVTYEVSHTETYDYDSNISTYSAPSLENYTFSNWTFTPNTLTELPSKMPSYNIVAVGVYNRDKSSITIKSNSDLSIYRIVDGINSYEVISHGGNLVIDDFNANDTIMVVPVYCKNSSCDSEKSVKLRKGNNDIVFSHTSVTSFWYNTFNYKKNIFGIGVY